jgi:hypothetical protein
VTAALRCQATSARPHTPVLIRVREARPWCGSYRQAAKALLRPWNESGLCRVGRPAQSAIDSVLAGRANRQAGADMQCRRLSFVGWSLRLCFSFKAARWRAERMKSPDARPGLRAVEGCPEVGQTEPSVEILQRRDVGTRSARGSCHTLTSYTAPRTHNRARRRHP